MVNLPIFGNLPIGDKGFSHIESIEQLALNEVYVTVHFVSPGSHRVALAVRRAIHLARTAWHTQMYQ